MAFENLLKRSPNKENVPTTGSSVELVMDGTFKPVILPYDCSKVCIQGRPSATVYTNLDNRTEFHISFNEDGSGWQFVDSIILGIGKFKGEPVCYVAGAPGTIVSAMSLI